MIQFEIMKIMLSILQAREPMTKSELLDASYDEIDEAPKYQITNVWKRLKDEKMIFFKNESHSCIVISQTGINFLKEDKNAISLMEAISLLYHHKNKKERLSFSIRFTDKTERITIWKSWNDVLSCWRYGIKEPNCPSMMCSEGNFIGNLANITGISFGGNVPSYHVYLD